MLCKGTIPSSIENYTSILRITYETSSESTEAMFVGPCGLH